MQYMRPSLLPPGARCTAYWYAQHAGMLTGDGDFEFLRALGLAAWRIAGRHRLPEAKVPEGPYLVHQWPEWCWSQAADRIAEWTAEHGTEGGWDDGTNAYQPVH
jgi:hypothetical protein